jgi:hypothetical protein
MSCHAYRDLLNQRLDGTAPPGAGGAEHLRECPSCRALAAAARRLDEGLRLLALPAAPPELAARVVARVVADRRRTRRRRRRWVVTVGLAAGLLLALGLRLDWRGHPASPAPEAGAPVVQGGQDPGGEIKPPAEAPTLRQSAEEAGVAVAALTRTTAGETVEKTRSLLPQVSGAALPEPELPSLPAARPLREAGEGVSAGLEPVATSARRAVDLFLRELPPMDTGGKGL